MLVLSFMKFASLAAASFMLLYSCTNSPESSNTVLKAEAYRHLTDSIEHQPNDPELYYKRGAALLQKEQFVFAEADLQQAWHLRKEERYALALSSLLSRKSSDSAVAFLQKAAAQLPRSISLKIALARGFQQQGFLDKALSVCDEVIGQYPTQLDALQLKAELLQTQKKDAAALATLEKAYGYAPSDVELAHNLAFLYAQSANRKALALADSLIKADVKGAHAEPYFFKGIYFATTGNKSKALQFFDEAIQHDYYFLDAYMEKGSIFFESKDYKKALHTFTLATTVSPTFADAYYWLGKTKEAMGNRAEASLDYQRAYSLDKNLKEAREAAENMR